MIVKALRRITIFILDYWMVLCMGMILTTVFVNMMYGLRGYFAIGGEWMILPLMIAARHFTKQRRA